MKRLFLAASVLGLSVSASAQGYVALDNNASTNRSPSATSSGLFFHNTINQWTAVLLSGDFNAAFYGGTDSANLSLIASFSGAAAAGSAFFGDGTWTDPQGRSYTVPGLEYTPANSSGTAFFKVEAWVGSATSYAAAVAAGAPTGVSFTFSSPWASLPNLPPDLTGMPAICLCYIPEPGAIALIGLGIAAPCIFQRRYLKR